MGRRTFCKLTTTGNKPCFLMSDVENDGRDGIQLTVSDGELAWSGDLTGDDLDDMSRKIKMKFSDFVLETVKAFTRENVGSLNFEYQIKTCADDALEMTWKKHMAADDIKFQLGKVVLQQESDPSDIHKEIFSFCISSMVELKDRINSLETDNDRLAQERGHALKRLEKCVAAKEELEKDLYAKFTAVLNSKKEKIRELNEELEDRNSSNGAVTTESVPKPAKASTSKRRAGEMEESDEEEEVKQRDDKSDDETTDDEKTPSPKRGRGRASVKQRKSEPEDTSLVLDDGMEDEDTTVSRRPRRQASGGKKQTPSKPVLPRVSSGGRKPTSDSKRSSLRKSGSGSSSKSSTEVVDADALLDDL